MQVDFLIVGQGLAGTLLAQALRSRGQSVAVVDDGWRSSASQVAAACANASESPVTSATPWKISGDW